MGWIILIVCVFIALGMYSCCVVAKQAEEAAEEMRLKRLLLDSERLTEAAIAAKSKYGKWVPCEERLPSEYDEVLVTWTTEVASKPLIAIAEYEPDEFLYSGGKWYFDDDIRAEIIECNNCHEKITQNNYIKHQEKCRIFKCKICQKQYKSRKSFSCSKCKNCFICFDCAIN